MLALIGFVTLLQPVLAWLPTGALGWGNDESPPVRRDINDLAHEGGPQFSLFILALEEVQERPEDDDDSYFQIAGELPVAKADLSHRIVVIVANGHRHTWSRVQALQRGSVSRPERARLLRSLQHHVSHLAQDLPPAL